MRLWLRMLALASLIAVLVACRSSPPQPMAAAETALFGEVNSETVVPRLVKTRLQQVMADPTTRAVGLVKFASPSERRAIFQNPIRRERAPAFQMTLPSGEPITLTPGELEQDGTGDFYLYADLLPELNSGLGGSAVIRGDGDDLQALVFLEGRQFELRPAGSGYGLIRETDPSVLPPDHPPGFNAYSRANPELRKAGPYTNEIVRIAVLVPYTRAAEMAIRNSGYVSIPDFVQKSVDAANLSFRNSQVNVRIEIARIYRSAFAETGNWNRDVQRFFQDSKTQQDRDAARADVVLLLFNNRSSCGQAQSRRWSPNPFLAVVYWACSIINLSFGHEIAHLQGADHNKEDVTPPLAFPYGHGHRHRNRWRTVMTYPGICNKCPRLPYYSNPSILHPSDRVPMGDTTHNNARVLRETAQTVSGYR